MNNIEWVDSNPGPGQFTTLISKLGQWYSITYVSRDGSRTEWRDSLKKIPLPVKDIPAAFGLTESKLAIDYTAHRERGYVPTKHEWEYLKADIVIVARAMRTLLSTGATALTMSSDSMREYKRLSDDFKQRFPILPVAQDTEIRKAYRGGWTYANTRYAKQIIGPGIVLDVNSLYPYVMRERPLPYGEPVYVDGPPPRDAECYITSITFTARIKPDHLPCIQIKGSAFFRATEYLEEISEPQTMAVTNVDLTLWREQYDLNIISFNGTFVFKWCHGMFNDYIDKWGAVKAKSKGGMRTIAKLHLNSLCGKFATNTDTTCKRPILSDGRVKLVLGTPEEREPVYTPVGVFVTSWARDLTIRAAQANYPRFLYADTDSIHLIGTNRPRGLGIHPTRLGAWKIEARFAAGVYLRAKQYTERLTNGAVSTHIAGLPSQIAREVTPDNILQGGVFHGKLQPKAVPGGVVLTETDFTLQIND